MSVNILCLLLHIIWHCCNHWDLLYLFLLWRYITNDKILFHLLHDAVIFRYIQILCLYFPVKRDFCCNAELLTVILHNYQCKLQCFVLFANVAIIVWITIHRTYCTWCHTAHSVLMPFVKSLLSIHFNFCIVSMQFHNLPVCECMQNIKEVMKVIWYVPNGDDGHNRT